MHSYLVLENTYRNEVFTRLSGRFEGRIIRYSPSNNMDLRAEIWGRKSREINELLWVGTSKPCGLQQLTLLSSVGWLNV